eukprot:CAMPEP_0197854572 /NCGR_PEP_ID=MMETSP1438-20131217/24914_1 /TAXON_ID=1461541 /ORGANISM="Pterosperma sp., Strain CCMP1384" /LENGTH=219 /DNA_ID=CAMNT_0043469351 /DNA_START=30 /DNA_END=689 /DNA_ORIENTATION=-
MARTAPGQSLKPPTPYITKPVKLPALRNPETGLLDDTPASLIERQRQAMDDGRGQQQASFSSRPSSSSGDCSSYSQYTSTLNDSTSLYSYEAQRTPLASRGGIPPSRAGVPPSRGGRKGDPFRLPMNATKKKASDARSIKSIDIVDRDHSVLGGGQAAPMVLNVENYEDSSLEVLQMELDRSDDEDDMLTDMASEMQSEMDYRDIPNIAGLSTVAEDYE